MTGILTAALAYAARGWPVFPCKVGTKVPITAHGFKDATTDPDMIRRWWSTAAANVAIATGAPAVDVLDVDVKPDGSGYAAFNRLKRAGLLDGAQALVQTPSGGLHAYFAGTAQGCGALRGQFLDFKATGGYVIAPPSTVSGRPYVLLDRREAGGRLDWTGAVRLLAPATPRPSTGMAPRWNRPADLERLAAWVAKQGEGNRNNGLFWAACRAVEHGHRDLEGLVEAAVTAGLDERSARLTVESARGRTGVVA